MARSKNKKASVEEETNQTVLTQYAPEQEAQSTTDDDLFIIGIGASAGGLEALQLLFANLPEEMDKVVIIVAQHLSPTYKSMLVQLLSRSTARSVLEIENNMAVKPNCIYITPPDSEITYEAGKMFLSRPQNSFGPKPSVDTFFTSLAIHKKERAIGVILSGTGSDGARGIEQIHNYGGLTIAQVPSTAKYNGMPLAAIQTGVVDLEAEPERIGADILEYIQTGINDDFRARNLSRTNASALNELLKMLSHRTGTDFSDYKPSTILRRLEKRIEAVKAKDLEEYISYIRSNQAELDLLFNTILIGVTKFFRDDDAFKELQFCLKQILDSHIEKSPIRIWVAGCATGEEPHTIAILLSELLGDSVQDQNVQIFATDIDDHAISIARKGVYSESSIENVPPDILERYFKKNGNKYEVIKPIRQLVLFSKHDVTIHPPFLKLDLISCRNLLIYFGPNLQKHVLPIFHYSLNPNGFLFLGKSESIGQFSHLFNTVHPKFKIYQRKQVSHFPAVRFSAFKPTQQLNYNKATKRTDPSIRTMNDMIMHTLYNTFSHPYVIVNDTMDVQEMFGDVSKYLSLKQGAMNANIVNLVSKELQIEVRSLVTKSIKDHTSLRGELKEFPFPDRPSYVRIHVNPLLYTEPHNELFMVTFEEVELAPQLRSALVIPKDGGSEDPRVTQLEQELAATKEHLQTYIEELETANEELQSLNEELQSSNEELQSSNEELETSNEELQSSNEEIQIAYTELRQANIELEKKDDALMRSEANIAALLNNSLQAFILIDRSYTVITFNNAAQEYSLRLFEKQMKHGNSIIDYIMGNEMSVFREGFNDAVSGKLSQGEYIKRNSDGSPSYYLYNFSPVRDSTGKTTVISFSLLDATETLSAKAELAERERMIDSIFQSTDIGICVTDVNGRFVKVNKGYLAIYGYSEEELLGNEFTMVVTDDFKETAWKIYHDFLNGIPEMDSVWKVVRKGGEIMEIYVSAHLMVLGDNIKYKVTTIRRLK